MAANPYFDPSPLSQRRAVFEYLLRILRTHLEKRASELVIPDAELRALHPLLVVPGVWDRVRKALGL